MLKKLAGVVLVWVGLTVSAWAQINLQPKYGGVEKNAAQRAADTAFVAETNRYFNDDRTAAAKELSQRGWEFLRKGKADDAMRRFNQAWMLNSADGAALWGMAVVQMEKGQVEHSLGLFEEAAQTQSGDIDFLVDRARAMGYVAASTRDAELRNKVWTDFEHNYRIAPQHTLNLQNWAISYFHAGRYSDAWDKIALAEKTPRGKEVDPAFIKALNDKMRRPPSRGCGTSCASHRIPAPRVKPGNYSSPHP